MGPQSFEQGAAAPRRGLVPMFDWFVAVDADEAAEVREARLRTMPDSRLLTAMAVGWSLGGAVFALVVVRAPWALVWLLSATSVQAIRIRLIARCHRAATSAEQPPHVGLLYANLASFVVLAIGIVALLRTGEPRMVAVGTILTLGWMSYVASRAAAFPRLSTALLYLLGWSMAIGLASSPTLWIIGLFAMTFPVAYQVMTAQNHTIVCSALRAQHENRLLSTHDPLTGLPNRLLLDEWIATRSTARPKPGAFAVLYLDLDDFKKVNDTHGHPAGDRLLELLAARLRSCVRRDAIVCRIGGDEFVVVLDHVDRTRATEVAKRLISTCAQEYDLGDSVTAAIGVTVGIASCPEDGSDPSTILSMADTALLAAKQSAKGTWSLHDHRRPDTPRRSALPPAA